MVFRGFRWELRGNRFQPIPGYALLFRSRLTWGQHNPETDAAVGEVRETADTTLSRVARRPLEMRGDQFNFGLR